MGTYLTKGSTFTTGDTVTAANLNNLVDNATVTAGSIGSTELGANAVTNGKIIATATGSEPVTTGTIRDNAVSNAKLAGMTRGTVKVGDSSGAASDLSAKTNNAFLTGDGTDLKSKTFDSGTAGDITITSTSSNFYLEVASNSIANAMVKNDAINPAKISHSTSSNPGLIVYGASGVPAELTTTASNSVLTSNGSSAPSWETGLLAKAFCNFTSNISTISATPLSGQVTTVDSATFNIAAGDHTTDGTTTTTGGVQQTGVGTYKVTFSSAMPNTNYIVIGNGWHAADSKHAATVGTIVTKDTAYFTFTTAAETTVFPNVAYFQLVVFGLG